MPDYDFNRAECQKRFTVAQTFEEHDRDNRVKCPKCGSQKVERVIGTVSETEANVLMERPNG